eukprot:6842848-Pyramimonas_sp.AAC.1
MARVRVLRELWLEPLQLLPRLLDLGHEALDERLVLIRAQVLDRPRKLLNPLTMLVGFQILLRFATRILALPLLARPFAPCCG